MGQPARVEVAACREPQTAAECLAVIQQLYRALPKEVNNSNHRRADVAEWAEIRRYSERYVALQLNATHQSVNRCRERQD